VPDQILIASERAKGQFRQGILPLTFVLPLTPAFLPTKEGGDTFSGVIGLAGGIAVVIGVAVLMYVMKLTVRVDEQALHVRFFPLVKKDIPLEDIARWEARNYRPILEYGGWGIRCRWKGMAYNVSGKRGVQLEFTNGKLLLIGSQRPEELAAAISQAKQQGVGCLLERARHRRR
jgi:hypothetical protein